MRKACSASRSSSLSWFFALADVVNELHLFNPDWPPHARFHNAMQGTALLLMSVVSFVALFGPLSWRKALVASLAPITFWPGLLVAWFVPGTSPYASKALEEIGVPINMGLAAVFILLTLGGLCLARFSKANI